MLHHDRFSGLWTCDDQAALPLADWSKNIQNTTGQIFFAFNVTLKWHDLIGVQWGQVFEHDPVLNRLGRETIDLVDFDQSKIALAIFGRAHFAFN